MKKPNLSALLLIFSFFLLSAPESGATQHILAHSFIKGRGVAQRGAFRPQCRFYVSNIALAAMSGT